MHQDVVIPNPGQRIKEPQLEEAPTELVRSREEITGDLVQFETFDRNPRSRQKKTNTAANTRVNTDTSNNPPRGSDIPELNMRKLN